MPCVGAATTPACSVPECARERHRRACANAPPSWRVFPPESETRSPDCNSCCSACVCLPPAGSAPWACSTELPSAKTCWCSCRNSVRKSVGAAIAATCSGEGGAGGVCAQECTCACACACAWVEVSSLRHSSTGTRPAAPPPRHALFASGCSLQGIALLAPSPPSVARTGVLGWLSWFFRRGDGSRPQSAATQWPWCCLCPRERCGAWTPVHTHTMSRAQGGYIIVCVCVCVCCPDR